MSSDWKFGKLGDIADVVMGTSPPGNACSSADIGLPLLNGPTEFGPHHPVAVQFTREQKRTARSNDILFCVRGSTTGRMNWADQTYVIGRGLAAIRHKFSDQCQHFVRAVIEYSLSSLLSKATGSTFPCVTKEDIQSVEICIPSEREQVSISRLLAALDDKIELNRQMNTTLEQVARALFKTWFVDLDLLLVHNNARYRSLIPSGGNNRLSTKLGQDGLPEGWKMGRLDDIADVIMGTSPPSSTYNDIGLGTALVNGPVEFGDRFPVTLKWTTAPSRLCKANDLIFCVRGSTTGRRVISDGEYCLGRGVCAISSKDSQTYVNLHIDFSLDKLLAKCNGSTFPNLNGPEIKSHPTLIPSDTVLELFADITKPWYEQIIENSKEINALIHIRDSLLPQLLSGKIRLRQADKLVEEAVT